MQARVQRRGGLQWARFGTRTAPYHYLHDDVRQAGTRVEGIVGY